MATTASQLLARPGVLARDRWQVEVRRSGSGQVLAAVEASGDRWEPERLWDRLPRPVLGELAVTVTPLGAPQATGLRQLVAVAEGLDVSYSPALRLTDARGLEPAEAVLSPAPGMTASPRAAMIPGEVTGVETACVAGPVVLPLRVTPPHCRVRIVQPKPIAETSSPVLPRVTVRIFLLPSVVVSSLAVPGGSWRRGVAGHPPGDLKRDAGQLLG